MNYSFHEEYSKIVSKVNDSRNFISNTTGVVKEKVVLFGSHVNQEVRSWLRIWLIWIRNPFYFMIPMVTNFFGYLWSKSVEIYREVCLTFNGVLPNMVWQLLKYGTLLLLIGLIIRYRRWIVKFLVGLGRIFSNWLINRHTRWSRWIPVPLRSQSVSESWRECKAS